MRALALAAVLLAPAAHASAPSPTELPYYNGMTSPAIATATAVRGIAWQETPPPAPPAPVGLLGLPFAPEGLDDCAEMTFYRVQWGLPALFDRIGWRESNCRNEDGVRTSCCFGFWQLHVYLHLRDHRIAPLYESCGVASHEDINSDTPEDKQRQACATAALYSVVGTDGWVATR